MIFWKEQHCGEVSIDTFIRTQVDDDTGWKGAALLAIEAEQSVRMIVFHPARSPKRGCKTSKVVSQMLKVTRALMSC